MAQSINAFQNGGFPQILQAHPQQPISQKMPEISFSVSAQDDIFQYHSMRNKVMRVAWLIFSIIIFPIGMIRLIGKLINFKATKNGFLPGLEISKDELDQERAVMKNYPYFERCKRMAIQTADKVKLDTLMIDHPSQSNLAMDERKYIIFFNGNAGTYEGMLPTLMEISDKTGANVYCGNYRGVGYSEGFPTEFQDLVMDGEAMVRNLLKQGVKPENILIHGWSLGGAVGAHVAALHPGIPFCSDRSFSTMVREVKELSKLIRKNISENKNLLSKLIAVALVILTPPALALIQILGWNFQSLKCYKKIQGYKFIIYHPNDDVIPYEASLYKRLKDLCKNQKNVEQAFDIKAIQLSNKISGGLAHVVPVNELNEFNDYQANVALAFAKNLRIAP